MGDFNARLIYPTTDVEETIMGKYTLHVDDTQLEQETFTDDMMDNRDLLIEYCIQHTMKVKNTMYRKTNDKMATYRKKKEKPEPGEIEIFSAETHEQLDYIMTNQRWKNSITNADSDTTANINSDHFPVVATINLKLRKQNKEIIRRNRYLKCTDEQRENFNEK